MDRFELISKLGEGSYSVVFKVRRKADSKIYALKKVRLKKLSEKEKKNSLNEVRILASIKSSFIISYKEAFIDETEPCLCIVMEYAEKGDLYQKITHFKRMGYSFDEKDIWKIFIQMLKGLKSLHDLKILHRDLKSANVFLFNDGSAKIGDLNVSKVAKKGLGYTQTGTPYYASPEVWRDEPYDSKSDIWSLGCVTYEMLTLNPPFRAESMKGLYEKVIKGKYPKISDKYSSDISDMLKLLFKLNPNERPSCDEILKNPIVIKRLEFFKSDIGNDKLDIANMDEAELLKTIRIPKNILFLSNKLPKANYETSSTESNDKIEENIKEIKNHYNINNTNNNNININNPNNININNPNNINNININKPNNNNSILPFIKKINKRYINNNKTENNNSERRNRHLDVINERAHIIEEINDSNESSIKSPKKNNSISPTSLKRVPYSDLKLNNILKYQKQRRQIVPSISRPKNGLNKGLSELYRLYVSSDYKKPINKKHNVPYLPNIYRRNNINGKPGNNNSYIYPNNLNSQKKLISLNIKI